MKEEKLAEYKHDAEKLSDAIGITKERATEILKFMCRRVYGHSLTAKHRSKAIENIENDIKKLNSREVALLIHKIVSMIDTPFGERGGAIGIPADSLPPELIEAMTGQIKEEKKEKEGEENKAYH